MQSTTAALWTKTVGEKHLNTLGRLVFAILPLFVVIRRVVFGVAVLVVLVTVLELILNGFTSTGLALRRDWCNEA